MKRLMCMILSVLFVVSFVYTPAAATEIEDRPETVTVSNPAMKAYVEGKAVEAFPEFASKIRGEHLSMNGIASASTVPANEVVFSETRAISDTEFVNYTEYANGIAVTSLMAHAGKNTYSTVDGGTYTTYSLNAWLTVAGSDDLLMVYGVQCRVNDSGSNSMVNYGYVETVQTTATSAMRGGTKASGTASSPAYVEYSAWFTIEVSTGGEPIVTTYNGYLNVSAGSSGPTVSGR